MPIQFALLVAVIGGQAAPPVSARNFGPDTCVSGFVWREAFEGDHVCVTPEVRAQAADDNQRAAERRAPGGGPYGPDTCRPGFVWRDARPGDHVCVSPETRSQAAQDNQAAAGRYVRTPDAARAAARVLRPDRVATPVAPRLSSPPARSGNPVKRGFDENGDPYIEEPLPDGSIRREQRSGVTVIAPDGSKQFFPNRVVFANAQPPTPPELPIDPARGRAWMSLHNEQLLAVIRALVGNDPVEMQRFSMAESKQAGDDLFKQLQYRVIVLQTLAQP